MQIRRTKTEDVTKKEVTRREKRLRAKADRERFNRTKKIERHFAIQLKRVAKHVGHIVQVMAPGGVVKNQTELNLLMERYSELLKPWAKAVSSQMIAEVSQRNETAWFQASEELGLGIRQEIKHAPTGIVTRALLNEQVDLIQSIPIKAARRVHHLTLEALSNSSRANEIAKEIQRTTHVTESRAKLIARTEVARTSASLTQARAEFVGATHYTWETAQDADVRHSHKEMQGEIIAYDDPPTLSDGTTGHAGTFPNCRCYQAPILPREIK